MPNEKPDSQYNSKDLVRATLARLSLLLQFEKKILAILAS